MQSYKERVKKLRQSEDPDEYILENAKRLFPTKDKYHQIIDDYKSWYGKDPQCCYRPTVDPLYNHTLYNHNSI